MSDSLVLRVKGKQFIITRVDNSLIISGRCNLGLGIQEGVREEPEECSFRVTIRKDGSDDGVVEIDDLCQDGYCSLDTYEKLQALKLVRSSFDSLNEDPFINVFLF